jgi:septum formation protein
VPFELVLASGSPQRRAILEQLGIPFTVRVSAVEEIEEGRPEDAAAENARRKARAVAATLGPLDGGAPALVLGVDTIVVLDGTIYGKPADAAGARAMLQALSGRRHAVISGICLLGPHGPREAVVGTEVQFRRLDDQLLDWYVATGEGRDRSGAYAIQERGAALVTEIAGDYLNVVGLPATKLFELAPELLGARS